MINKGAGQLENEARFSPIDAHVGSRIRFRRIILGMTQEDLGAALGLTYQQMHKYERGINRVGASRLFEISRVLDVSVSYLFEEMPEGMSGIPASGSSGRMSSDAEGLDPTFAMYDDKLGRRETLDFVQAYYRIPDPAMRLRVFDLIKSMGPADTHT
jgi:transcriptional regulator with XRE-family HTH domain